MSVFLGTLVFEAPTLSLFFIFNLMIVIATAIGGLCLVFTDSRRLTRLPLVLAFFVHLHYQWPLVFFSNITSAELGNYWWFASFTHIFVIALCLWSYFTPVLNAKSLSQAGSEFKKTDLLVPSLFLSLFVTLYLSRVPFSCTAIYALLFDPQLTLLAREFSLKFVGRAIAAYSYGAIANVVSPIVVAVSFAMAIGSFKQRKYVVSIGCLLVFATAIFSTLLVGAKGMLIPSIIMLAITTFIWNNGWFSRVLGLVASIVFLAVILVLFELSKERGNSVASNYEFAACSVNMGVCEKSAELLASVSTREVISLGISHEVLRYLQERLDIACSGGDLSLHPKKVFSNDIKLGAIGKKAGGTVTQNRFLIYGEALIYRAFVIPFQVSVWHNMYVAEFGSPGVYALPLANRFSQSFINMPEQVFQNYSSVYLGGDKTSTGTAPTGFMMAYSAYWGWLGLLLSITLVVIVDLVFALLVRLSSPKMLPLLIGLIFISCFNFIISDFGTVLLSHGLIVGWIVYLACILFHRRFGGEERRGI